MTIFTDSRARCEREAVAYVADDMAVVLDEIAGVLWRLLDLCGFGEVFTAGARAFITATVLRDELRYKARSYRVDREWEE